MFILKMETDNAAFENAPGEICRILKRVALQVVSGETSRKIMDANGNSVGSWELVP